MAENEEIDRLKRRLSWEGAGPLAELSNRATDALTARGRSVRKLGARDGRGPAADQPVDCFPNWLCRRPLGAASCEALIFSSWPSTRRSCGCGP